MNNKALIAAFLLLTLLFAGCVLIHEKPPWQGQKTGTGAGNVDCSGGTVLLDTAGAAYTMNASSTIDGANCFNVTAANVTLDCQGYSINGTGDNAIYAENQYNTTIRNCIISNISAGVYLMNSTRSNVINTTITEANFGIRLEYGRNNAITNIFANASAAPVQIGILLDGETNDTVLNSRGATNGGTAVYVSNTSGSMFRNVTSTGGNTSFMTYAGSEGNIYDGCLFEQPGATAGTPAIIDSNNNIFANSTFNCSTHNQAFDMGGHSNIFINNTFIVNDDASQTVYLDTGNNTFYLNNFTESILYINDINGSNFYNATGSSVMCYQETATTATACGGLATGSYGGMWSPTHADCSVPMYDGNWSTSCEAHDNVDNVFYVNYTKIGTNNSKLQVKYPSIEADGGFVNLTIPSTCFAQSNLQFLIDGDRGTQLIIQCYNGSSWVTMLDKSVWVTEDFPTHFTEEAMWWNIARQEGNIYANVLNGSVSIQGTTNSSIAGLYIGTRGTGFPYSNTTSGGKFSCNFAGCQDNAPLTINNGTISTQVLIRNATGNYVPFDFNGGQMNFRCSNPFPSYCQPQNQSNTTGIPILVVVNNGSNVSSTYRQIKTNETWNSGDWAVLMASNETYPTLNVSTTFQNYSTATIAAGANQSLYVWLYVKEVPANFPRTFNLTIENK